MKITADYYIVLWGLFHAGQFSTDHEVSWKAKMDLKPTLKCLWHMTQRDFCDGDQWVDLRKKNGQNRWLISGRRGDGDETTGGWRALLDSAANPVIVQAGERMWRDEVLTGITVCGTQSSIINAALGRR